MCWDWVALDHSFLLFVFQWDSADLGVGLIEARIVLWFFKTDLGGGLGVFFLGPEGFLVFFSLEDLSDDFLLFPVSTMGLK